MRARSMLAVVVFAGAGCTGSAGGELIDFQAYGAGPIDAKAGSPYAFTTGRGFQVSLTQAKLHVGALYLNKTVPTSVASNTSCYLPGIYVAEVTAGLDLDVLSPELQPFPAPGFATSEQAKAAEVWLSDGDINAESSSTVILDVAGTASKAGISYPFEGTITIGNNRVVTPNDPALPGSKPICKQRIVTPIPVDITPQEGGHLLLRVDPRGWFSNVDFSKLESAPGDPPTYVFKDSSDDQPSTNLYLGVRASIGVYRFTWE